MLNVRKQRREKHHALNIKKKQKKHIRGRTRQGEYNKTCEARATLEGDDRARHFAQLKRDPMDHVCALCWQQDPRRASGDAGWKWFSYFDLAPIHEAWNRLRVLGRPYEMEVDFFDLVRKDSTQTVPEMTDMRYPYGVTSELREDGTCTQDHGLHLKTCHSCDLAIKKGFIPRNSMANDLVRGRVPA
jgi:hypothetical protein